MPYEDDYKAWLEKALIETNPDWVCDGMCDTEFTHDWCSKYCGKDDAYITPKCLHMYYHHIATADRKTEPSNSEKPNNCETCKMGDAKPIPLSNRVTHIKDEPQYEMGMGTLKCDNCSEYGSFKCTKCDGEMYFKRLEPKDEPQTIRCLNCTYNKDEPQTDCAWK